MKARIHLRNETHFIEFPDTPEGKQQAISFRKENRAFARRRLVHCIQAMPEKVPFATVMELT